MNNEDKVKLVMWTRLLVMVSVLMTALILVRANAAQNLEVVPSVDLARYVGKWYEIARLPNRFESKCAGEVTASYSRLADGRLNVINECRLADGRANKVEGQARLAGKGDTNSKLEVRFAPAWLGWLPAVWGDYWIIDLAPDYSYAVVGTPDRKYFWVLARSPQMDEALYQKLVERARAKGFDVSRLIKTRQSG